MTDTWGRTQVNKHHLFLYYCGACYSRGQWIGSAGSPVDDIHLHPIMLSLLTCIVPHAVLIYVLIQESWICQESTIR